MKRETLATGLRSNSYWSDHATALNKPEQTTLGWWRRW